MASMEGWRQSETLSDAHENAPDSYRSENEISSLAVIYSMSLGDTTLVEEHSSQISKDDNSDGSSTNGSDDYFEAVGALYEDDAENSDDDSRIYKPNAKMDRFSSDENQEQRPQGDYQNQNLDESVPNSRRKISFVNDQNRDRNNATPSKQNRSMEIRMDGHILITDSDESKNSNVDQTESNTLNSMINLVESIRSSPTLVGKGEGIADKIKNKGDNHYRSIAQPKTVFIDSHQDDIGSLDVSFNTVTSVPPVALRPLSLSNVSVASSDGTSRMMPSSYNTSGAYGYEQETIIPEENTGVATSFENDDSDVSSTTGTGLTGRLIEMFSMHRISILIVKWMPYVCSCCFRNENELRGNAFSDRFILARLNLLSFFFSIIQVAACLWLVVVVYIEGMINDQGDDYEQKNYLWNNNWSIIMIGCLAVILLFTCRWTTRIVKEVDLAGALRFLWLLLWILPIAVYFNIAAFDSNEVTKVWIRHNWNSIQLLWFRKRFCFPETARSLCLVPIGGGLDYASEDDWCFDRHNVTGCAQIRDDAQKKTAFLLLTFYKTLASWGCFYMFIMLLIIKTLERIISKPMVQKSREGNVVGWLIFPVIWTALYGSLILSSPYTYIDKLIELIWVGYLYLTASGLFLIALLMGWFLSAFSIRSNVDKQNKSNAALILVVVLFINSFVLLTILVSSIVWLWDLQLDDNTRGAIACTMNSSQCTNCDSQFGRCPEWDLEEITKIVRRQMKQSAVVAAIFIMYDVNVMIHGFNLRSYLTMYQIDYV